MKSNLKEKVKEQVKKSKIITNVNFNKDDEKKIISTLSDVWKNEIKNFKTQNFSSLKAVKKYIVDVILERQNMIGNKECEKFLYTILDSDIEVEKVLNEYVKN